VVAKLEQDTAGKGCIDLVQRYDAAGAVVQENKDSNGDCKIDTWTYLKDGAIVRQGQDTKGVGRPDVLTVFGADGRPVAQELVSDPKRRRPDKKLSLDASGQVTAQCVDTDGNGTLDARAVVSGGAVSEVWIDTKGKGVADQRELYQGGQRVALEADTNGDRKADVVQTFSGGAVGRQDEDTNFDGVVDQRFEGGKAVAVPAGTKLGTAPLGPLECGRFSDFWTSAR
jgi:hypothetical protein